MKTNFIFFLSMILASCNINQQKIITEDAVLIDRLPGSSPYISNDQHGNVIVCWAREINDSSSLFCYARSTDGKTFSEPVVVPASTNLHPHAENLPKMIVKPSGEIIALWGAANPNPKNKYSGLVFYSQSFDDGKTWSAAKPLTTDAASYDQRYYDVALLPDGEAAIIWLDNRKQTNKEGSALYFAKTKGRNGFAEEQLITESCCQCCRTDLFIDQQGGVHALYRGIINDSIRDMMHTVSTDAGKSFTTPSRISNDNWVLKGCPHTGPSMTANANGLHFAWFTGAGKKGCFYTQSKDNGKNFAVADSVSSAGSHPQMTTLYNGDLLIAWDETVIENKQPVKRIALQKRNGEGKAQAKQLLLNSGNDASYPVITTTGKQQAVIAFTGKQADKKFIYTQLLK